MRKSLFLILAASFFMMFSAGLNVIDTCWAQMDHMKKGKVIINGKEIDVADIPDVKPDGVSEEEWWKIKAMKPMVYDKGPSVIDVSKYPKEMQDTYKNHFVPRCSKCHTIARAINSPYVLPAEWKTYIQKMMKKPGSGLNPAAAKAIYEFCVYDSPIRKKAKK